MEIRNLAFSVGLAVAALGLISAAQAAPMLQIEGPLVRETIGDAGGTSYAWAGGAGGGAGVPSAAAGWPNNGGGGYPSGFGPDPSYPPDVGGAFGTTGYDSGYLRLTERANVTFQFMGGGDSSLANQFWVNGVLLFQDHVTNPIAVAGDPPVYGPAIGGGYPNQNQYTILLEAGLIPFLFVTGDGITLDNTGAGNGNPNDPSGLPGYFLGIDPYLAAGVFQTEGKAVFAGLADRSRVNELDHDYQDMGVRITVPEPGSLLLLGAGLIGFVGMRRRKV